MPKEARVLPPLTVEQKAIIAKDWAMDVGDLTRRVFDNDKLDRRSAECKLVKQELASLNRPTVPASAMTLEMIPQGFTESQCEYIRNNFRNSTPLEMARIIVGDESLTLSSATCSLVTAYCRQIDPAFRKDEELCDGEYDPPSNARELITQVNRYAINPRHDGKPIYDQEKLTNLEQKQIRSLMGHMRRPLFRSVATKETRKSDRELFISTFVGYCWNKPDLVQEQADQYIAVAAETVKYTKIERTVQKLDDRLNTMLESADGALKMAEVELLNSVREKSNASMKQIAALIKTLVGERAKQKEERMASSASMHNLVEAWAQKENRDKIIQMNERKQKAGLREEVERLSDMDSLKAQLFGINPADILA